MCVCVPVCQTDLDVWFPSAGVEALVGWLLDHPDVPATELSDADTLSEEESDEEVPEEQEEAEPAFTVVGRQLLLVHTHTNSHTHTR